MREQSVLTNNESRSVQDSVKYLFGFLAFLICMLGFINEVNAQTVHGYNTEQECWDDVAQVKTGGPRTRYAEAHEDEKAFHVNSDLRWYSWGGSCYQANEDLRQLVSDQVAINVTVGGVSGSVTLYYSAAAKGAMAGIARVVAWILTWGITDVATDAANRDGPSDEYIEVQRERSLALWRDPCLIVHETGSYADGHGLGRVYALAKCRENTPSSGSLEDHERIPAPNPPNATNKKSVSEILASLDSLTKEEWDALSEAEQQQVIDALELLAAEEAAALAREDTADHTLGRTSRFLERLKEWRDKRDRG